LNFGTLCVTSNNYFAASILSQSHAALFDKTASLPSMLTKETN
jgi:hypothetical protein